MGDMSSQVIDCPKSIHLQQELVYIITIIYFQDWYETIEDNLHLHPTFKQFSSEFIPKNQAELETDYWRSKAKNFVEQQQAKEENQNVAKNLILFIGDGMSMVTQAATRVYLGGEEEELSFEKFPHLALSKVIVLYLQPHFFYLQLNYCRPTV
jgi:hypothetical protein